MPNEIRDLEARINKTLGEDLLISFKNASPIKDGLSSGSLLLNCALSGSPLVGYVWGRIVELYGPEQSGKTTFALHMIRECQKLGLPALFVDAEHALDIRYARHIGVDLDSLSICQPDYGEQGLSVVDEAISAGYRLVVIDSVPALVPKSELEGEMGDAQMGKQARMMGQAMRKLVGKASKAKTILVFINQIRMKLGVMFGNPETTPGGNALKFFASYRVEVRAPRGGAIKEKNLGSGTSETGITSKIKVVKNKLYPPYRTAEINIRYGRGIDRAADVVEYLKQVGAFEGKKAIVLENKKITANQLELALHKDAKMQKAVTTFVRQLVASGKGTPVQTDSDE